MIKYKILSSIIAVAFMVNFFVNLKFKSPDEEISIEDTNEVVSNETRKTRALRRTPASSVKVKEAVSRQEDFKASNLDPSNGESTPAPAQSNSISPSASRRGYQSSFKRTPISNSYDGSNNTNEKVELAKKSKEEEQSFLGKRKKTKTLEKKNNVEVKKDETTDSSSTASGESGGATTSYTCSSNIAGGAFSNSIGITLSCTIASTIKYCVALDTGSGCCDPLSAGATYNAQITIGPQNGTYCLSYIGETASAVASDVYQQSYIIDSTLPNLQVSHPQINYQTTQLNGKSFITSTDFGNIGYGIGQINLKTHDPGPAGLNYTCDDIIANYVSLPAPAPITILSLLDVSLDNPALQIEIPFQAAQLEYGDNFITSYIENNNFAAPIYACSTSKIVLNDFEFFQEELAFGDAGTNTVREFTGGLSPYGFFEPDATVYRGPAGVDSFDSAGQKLQFGMFGIFY